MFFWIEISF